MKYPNTFKLNLLKHFGNTFEYKAERDADLLRAFREALMTSKSNRIVDIWERVANSPSARFWVSAERAAIVVSRMLKGDTLHYMRPLRRQMFEEILKRVKEIMAKEKGLSVYNCCIRVVAMPAPKFYITPPSVTQIVYKIRRQWRKEKKRQ